MKSPENHVGQTIVLRRLPSPERTDGEQTTQNDGLSHSASSRDFGLKKRFCRVGLAALLIVMLTGSLACRPRRRPDPKVAEQRTRGESFYAANCALCHGGYGYEGRAPDLYHSAVLSHDVNGNLLGPIARAGRPALGMPAFSNLTSSQIADLAAFLHFMSNHIRDLGSGPERLLTGDAAKGRAYFAAACSGCHSPTGDLAGIGARMNGMDLQHRFLYPGYASGRKPTAAVTLPDGRKIEGLVVHDDEFTIAITGKDGWYHSWPRAGVKVEIHDGLAEHLALLEKYTTQDMHNLFAYLASLK